jgi:hypothetical protein
LLCLRHLSRLSRIPFAIGISIAKSITATGQIGIENEKMNSSSIPEQEKIEKFMKVKLLGICGIAAAMLAVNSVQAIPISGNIYMGGVATLNSSDTAVTSWPLVFVLADNGAFSSVSPFSLVTMSSSQWVFSPQPGLALNDLWSVGGFSFNFTSDTVSESGGLLVVDGSGTISSSNPKYSTTAFSWDLTAAVGGGDFVFVASTGNSTSSGGGGSQTVPDGGITLAFLGVALAGAELFRRQFTKA